MNPPSLEAGSFRDRNGRIYYDGEHVYRGISAQALRNWQRLSSTKFFHAASAAGSIIPTEEVPISTLTEHGPASAWTGTLKHHKIPFISYPYEWPFGMLKDAALQQLDLLAAALDEGMTLKDASSFNTQWFGAMPSFIDVPSFEPYTDGTPWIGYRQFCELFLYPLMLQAYKNISFQPLLRGRIEGIPPDECKNMMSFRDMFRPGVLLHVGLQAKLQQKYGGSDRQVRSEIRHSGFHKELIKTNVRKLRSLISKLEWKRAQSQWSHYAGNTSYSGGDAERKAEFIRSVVRERKRGLVWDLGCNTGTFSRIAAENSSYVVAMDSDHLAVEYLYRDLHREKNRAILPLVVNLSDASPNLGWKGAERKGLAERGKPDLILALALIHHIVISANIPMEEFVEWLASLGGELVIEFVTKEDPMVKKLLQNKDDQYDDYGEQRFERALRDRYAAVRSERLASGTRILFHAQNVKPAGK